MTVKKLIDQVRGTFSAAGGSAPSFSTALTIDLTGFMSTNDVVGFRLTAVCKAESGVHTEYGGLVEWVGAIVQGSTTFGLSQGSGNSFASGGAFIYSVIPAAPTAYANFAISGNNLLVQVSQLSGDTYKWLLVVDLYKYENT